MSMLISFHALIRAIRCAMRPLNLAGLLFTMSYMFVCLSALADGVGYVIGSQPGQIRANLGYRRNQTEDIQRVYIYLNVGEKMELRIQRLRRAPHETGGPASDLSIRFFSPTGLHGQKIVSKDLSMNANTDDVYTIPSIPEAGIWTVEMDGVNGTTSWGYDLNAKTVKDSRIAGRVFTEELFLAQSPSETTRIKEFELFHINQTGHLFHSNWYGYLGIDSDIRTNNAGVVKNGTCEPLYKSVETAGATFGHCGRNFKQFFSEPASDLPALAPRFDLATNSAVPGGDWLKPELAPVPVIGAIGWTASPSLGAPLKGAFDFTIENHIDNASLIIDVDNNGSYTDAVDRTIAFLAQENNIVPFDGKDGLGQPIPCGQQMKARVAVTRAGEIHFVMSDVEGLEGLKVARLNGINAPDYTLYWNDSDLAARNNPEHTIAVRNATAGVNSNETDGVHGWLYNAHDSWGNDRHIDNWTFTSVNIQREQPMASPACVTLSGRVLNDANGNTDGKITGEPLTAVEGQPLFANLVDADGIVVKAAPVGEAATNGMQYAFSGIGQPTSAVSGKIVLSVTEGVPGAPAPAATLPGDWINTGETPLAGPQRGQPMDEMADGIIDLTLTPESEDIDALDFGIERRPHADYKAFELTATPAAGSKMFLNGSWPATQAPTALTGGDAEDGTYNFMRTYSVRITTLPMPIDGGDAKSVPVLFYGKEPVAVTAGQLLSPYDFDLLYTELRGTGYKGFSFTYQTIDAAGAASEPVEYKVTWNASLPVKLVDFKATVENASVMLDWQTSEESNSSHFEIQRSGDGKNWKSLGAVAAALESKELAAYHFTDNDAASGINYYRLKMVDADSTFAFSRIVQVKVGIMEPRSIVFPNPAITDLLVECKGRKISRVEMADRQGRVVYRLSDNAGTDYVKLDTARLDNGIYILTISYPDGLKESRRIVVRH